MFELLLVRLSTVIETTITNQIQTSYAMAVVQLFLLLLIIFGWFFKYRTVKKLYSNIYGYVLVYPRIFLRENKTVFRIVEGNLSLTYDK